MTSVLEERPETGETTTLIIGYGSDIRGDDAVGRVAADTIARWQIPGVQAISTTQLTPELSAALAGVRRALFVDASADRMEGPTLTRVIPARREERIGHTGDPDDLMALTRAVFGVNVEARLLRLPAVRFDVGAGLSFAAEDGLAHGLRLVCRWLQESEAPLCMR